MAVRFEATDDAITIRQTRKGLRWTMRLIVIFGLFGIGITTLMSHVRVDTRVRCDHQRAACTLDKDSETSELTLASIKTVKLNGDVVELWRTEMPKYQALCGGDASASAFVDQWNAFLTDPAHAPIELTCTGRMIEGPPPLALLPVTMVGWLIIFALFARFSVEIHAVLDRRAGTIDVRGRQWFRRAWKVSRPLGDVIGIDRRRRYAGRGQYTFVIYAVFNDGSDVALWAPVASKLSTIDERVAKLREFIAAK